MLPIIASELGWAEYRKANPLRELYKRGRYYSLTINPKRDLAKLDNQNKLVYLTFMLLMGLRMRAVQLLSLAIMLLMLFGQKSQAALNDMAFNECIHALDQDFDILASDTWHKPPLNARIEQLIEPSLSGDAVIRWISHKNPNGTITIVVLTRDLTPDQPTADPDGFDVILQNRNNLAVKLWVSVNAFSFSKKSDRGVNSLLFCTQNRIFKWKWNGNTWKYHDGSTSK